MHAFKYLMPCKSGCDTKSGSDSGLLWLNCEKIEAQAFHANKKSI